MAPQPSNFGAYIGLSEYDALDDKVVVRLPVKRRHLNQMGLVHGGAIATLVDNSMGIACLKLAGRPLVTVEFKVNFVRPAHKGTLTGTSYVYKKGEHLAFTECDVTDEGGVLIAKAFGIYMLVESRP